MFLRTCRIVFSSTLFLAYFLKRHEWRKHVNPDFIFIIFPLLRKYPLNLHSNFPGLWVGLQATYKTNDSRVMYLTRKGNDLWNCKSVKSMTWKSRVTLLPSSVTSCIHIKLNKNWNCLSSTLLEGVCRGGNTAWTAWQSIWASKQPWTRLWHRCPVLPW